MGISWTFGELLKEYLDEQGRSQSWLARQIYVTPQTVSKWITLGYRPESPEMVNSSADALHLSPEQRKQLLIAAGYVYELQETATDEESTDGASSVSTETVNAFTPLFLSPSKLAYELVGRESLLHTLKERLLRGENIALTGLPGAGKTALAVTLAHDPDILAHFSDGVLWAGLGYDASQTTISAQ